MAVIPYFFVSPNVILSTIGKIRGKQKAGVKPAKGWRDAKVDVIIPAYNEERSIALCLTSLIDQTFTPRNIYVIDDGSSDNTSEYARNFSIVNNVEITVIRREKSIGKTPTLKRQSRESDCDVEFILDGDTVLESPNYISKAVEELYKGAGIASVCGIIRPMRNKDRKRLLNYYPMQNFLYKIPDANVQPIKRWSYRVAKFMTHLYRDTLYMFLQRFIYNGQMDMFGTIINPVGCAVAYRRKFVKDLFDKYEPIFGDDLSNSEDIFIGFALLREGYRNVQIQDVYARTTEPPIWKLPRQLYLWSSSFLQSCYYFNDLLVRPWKSWKLYKKKKRTSNKEIHSIRSIMFMRGYRSPRKVTEQYRQGWGQKQTEKYSRPIGWAIFLGAVEKVFFPTAILILLIRGLWEALIVTMIAEVILSVIIQFVTAKKSFKNPAYLDKMKRFEYFFKSLILTPIRYIIILWDVITLFIFAAQLWIFKKGRRWRK